MVLFNKANKGAEELVSVLGLIDSDLTFEKWAPIIPLGVRDLKAVIGDDTVKALDDFYKKDTGEEPAEVQDPEEQNQEQQPEEQPEEQLQENEQPTEEQQPETDEQPAEEKQEDTDAMREAVRLAQQAAAMFTWLKVIPTLEAQHGNAGRGKRLGENEHGLTGAQEFKDEDNIRNMAYEAIDALVELLDDKAFDFWTNSPKKKAIEKLLIRDKETFDLYYHTGSHRLFLTLVPMIREVQEDHIIPILTRDRFDRLLQGDETLTAKLMDAARRPLALLAIKKAVERLPIEILPTGIVQVQQSATVRDKVRAEKAARESVAAALAADAAAQLEKLTDLVMELEAGETPVDYHVNGPTLQTKGITF